MSSKNDSPRIKIKTETEEILYKYLCQEQEQRKSLEEEQKKLQDVITDLKHQVDILQQQLKCFSETKSTNAQTSSNMESTPSRVEYNTDEEDLARETEWIRVKSRKKRKLNTSPSLEESTTKEKPKKVFQPPPIVVDDVTNYQNLYDFIAEAHNDSDFTMKMMGENTVKINAANDAVYRAITEALNENKRHWHSYENKQQRPIRVMVKQLHHTCLPERIVEDVKKKGFKIIEAVNKLSWRSKNPLNMFMLTFENGEDINKIFKIGTILGFKVEIQPVKTTKLVPQCKRCQAYGHTQKYCCKEPRCVKCIGKHHTKDCKKLAEEKPKCIHCGAAHPANYRGCTIAKEIQLLRNNITKKPVVLRQNIQSNTQIGSTTQNPNTKRNATSSYAEAAGRSTKHASVRQVPRIVDNHDKYPQASHIVETNDKKLDEILQVMKSFDDRLKKIEGSTKTAKTNKH